MRAKYVSVHHASARGVAERWRNRYWRVGMWPDTCNGSSEEIYKNLCVLGPVPGIDAVADVIGNKSWSYLTCCGCSEYVKRAVSIGEDEPKLYCDTCVTEAFHVLLETQGGNHGHAS